MVFIVTEEKLKTKVCPNLHLTFFYNANHHSQHYTPVSRTYLPMLCTITHLTTWKERGTIIWFIPELVHNLASALALRAPMISTTHSMTVLWTVWSIGYAQPHQTISDPAGIRAQNIFSQVKWECHWQWYFHNARNYLHSIEMKIY